MKIARALSVLVCLLASTAFAIQAILGLWLPLTYDEGYNLQAVDNLAQGRGYASYGGLRFWGAAARLRLARGEGLEDVRRYLRGQGGDLPFDPYVTTGPGLLLPVALPWGLTRSPWALRLGILAVALVYPLVLWRLLPRGWPLATGVLPWLLLPIVLWPQRLLGEVPGTGFYFLGLLFLSIKKWTWAGWLWGIALQTKLMFVFPLAISGLYLLVWAWLRRKWRELFALGFAVAGPTILVEGAKLLALGGPKPWLTHWQEFRAFSKGWHGLWRPSYLAAKIASLWEALTLVGWLAVASLILLCLWSLWSSYDRPERPRPDVPAHPPWRLLALFASLGVIFYWLFIHALTDERAFWPAFLLAWPALVHWVADRIRGKEPRAAWPMVVFLALSSSAYGWQIHYFWTQREKLLEGWRVEQTVASLLAREKMQKKDVAILARGWMDQAPEWQVLSQVRGKPCFSGRELLLLTALQRLHMRKQGLKEKEIWARCGAIKYQHERVTLCSPRWEFWQLPTFRVEKWGPQQTVLGEVTNKQKDGWGAFWFTLDRPISRDEPIFGLLDGKPVDRALVGGEGRVITFGFPPQVVEKAGDHPVALWLGCRDETLPVGVFRVLKPPAEP